MAADCAALMPKLASIQWCYGRPIAKAVCGLEKIGDKTSYGMPLHSTLRRIVLLTYEWIARVKGRADLSLTHPLVHLNDWQQYGKHNDKHSHAHGNNQ